MRVLILKLGATGDVVRTTTLLKPLNAEVVWITADKNTILFKDTPAVRCFSWENRALAKDQSYDLLINLEDTADVATFAAEIKAGQVFGAYLNSKGELSYTQDAKAWFDMSLISVYGREEADKLKLQNRRTYQDLIFEALGFRFNGEPYILPQPIDTGLRGDVAIAAEAGPVWPMKKWAYYNDLKLKLEASGLQVNLLPFRSSLLEHIADVRNHRCLVGGDSLPMHLALGTNTRCVSIFNCTSPWEIHDYDLMIKLISPLLDEFFYKRAFDVRATTAVPFEQVYSAVLRQLAATEHSKAKAAHSLVV